MEKRKFYHCPICGNLFGVINDSGAVPVCCGQPMQALEPNTVDASQEKHVPALTRNGKELSVQIGSVLHPMEDAHYIQWIAVAQGNMTQRIALKPGEAPNANFVLDCPTDPVTVYAYCNLHGLWSANA